MKKLPLTLVHVNYKENAKVLAQIKKICGHRNLSYWLRQAVAEKLERLAKQK